MRTKMEVLSGAITKGVILRLPTVIGRGGDSKLKLPASTVSRHHCEVYEYEGQIVVRDLGSSNGTVVNGHKIKGPTFLTIEDELTIGPVTVRLYPVNESGRQPTPTGVLSDQEEALPDLQKLSEVESVLPVTAAAADVDAERSDQATDDSVLKYTEPESSGRSFVGISPAKETSQRVTEASILDSIE